MLGWLFAAPPERQLLPGGRLRGPTVYVIAIMTFVMMVVAAAGLALANAADTVARGIESRYAVEVPPPSLERAVEALSAAPGVRNVEAVSEQEMRRTLERWLGGAASARDLPVPALVNFDLANSAELARVSAAVSAAAPGAKVTAHEASLRPLLSSIRALHWVALALVVLMAAAAGASVILSARGALDTHRFTIEVMHGIGATDLQVTRLFQRKIALDALAGSAAGAAAALALLLVLAAGSGVLATDLTGGPALEWADVLALLALPLLVVVLATWVARATVLAALRKVP